jgi:hypothetical protein
LARREEAAETYTHFTHTVYLQPNTLHVMQQCISRHPSTQLTLLGARVGAKAAKAVLMSVAAGRLTPEILSEALQSSSTVRGHVQREAVKLLVVRVSLRTPQQLQWLLRLVGDYVGGASLTGAISSLTQRSLRYQITNFGLRGSAASAITTAAVQIGLTTCTLVTTNAAFWRKGDQKMSLQQYRYELLTSVYTGAGSVAGGAAGAALGSMVLPGVGTALGSVLCSVGVGYVPGYLRDGRGPDDRRRQQARELGTYTPLRMHDTAYGAVLMYKEELVETAAGAATATTTTTTAVASVAPSFVGSAGLSAVASTDVDSRSSSSDGRADEGEVVWLDFERATVPAVCPSSQPAMNTTAEEGGEAALATSHTTDATSASELSRECSDMDDGRLKNASTGVSSFLRFSPPSTTCAAHTHVGPRSEAAEELSAASSYADLGEVVEEGQRRGSGAVVGASVTASSAEGEGRGSSDRIERFEGYAKYITVTTDDALEAEVAHFGGEDDLVLVFAAKTSA